MTLTLPPGTTLVCATHNPGKAVEIAPLLEGRFTVLGAAELGLPEPEETEATFVGNAVLKARLAAEASGKICIADDSGLEVHALGGAPGVLSARWAEDEQGKRDFAYAMQRVEREVLATGSDNRDARFYCALAVAWPEGENAGACVVVEGFVTGKLVFPGRGTRGFGYDAIFQPNGHAQTFGEMDPDAKHAISHRADAFARLKTVLF